MLVLSHVQLFVTLWTVAHQSPLSTGFSRQESWSEVLFPPPWDLPHLGIKLVSPASNALKANSVLTESLGKPQKMLYFYTTYFHSIPER